MANARQFALIKEFVSLCDAASIPCWLRGGWAMDFFLGRVMHEHEDIDLFVWAKTWFTRRSIKLDSLSLPQAQHCQVCLNHV